MLPYTADKQQEIADCSCLIFNIFLFVFIIYTNLQIADHILLLQSSMIIKVIKPASRHVVTTLNRKKKDCLCKNNIYDIVFFSQISVYQPYKSSMGRALKHPKMRTFISEIESL